MRTPTNRFRRGLITPIAVTAIAASSLVALTSGAVFTDSSSVPNNAFTAGTIDIATTPASAVVAMPNLAPGDQTVGTVGVTNSGSLAMRYSMLSTTTNADNKALAAELVMTVKAGVADCTVAGFDNGGTVLYGPALLGATTGTKVFGDAAQGAQTGDRPLAAGTSENLCVKVALPATAGNNLQGATTTASFLFNAEQTVNN